MKLIKFVSIIDYNQVPEGLNLHNKLLKALTNNIQPNANPPTPQRFRLRVEKDKMFIAVYNQTTGIEFNQPTNSQSAINGVVNFYEKLLPIVNWNKVTRIAIKAMFIDEYSMKFKEFVPYFKSKIFKDSESSKESKDVGLSFEYNDGDNSIILNCGPMERKQLAEKVLPPAPFDINEIPEVFAFAEIDYSIRKEQIFSSLMLRNFITKAFDYSQNKVHKLFNELK